MSVKIRFLYLEPFSWREIDSNLCKILVKISLTTQKLKSYNYKLMFLVLIFIGTPDSQIGMSFCLLGGHIQHRAENSVTA